MSTIGSFPDLYTIDNWVFFSDRLEAYFALNNIDGDKRKSILITAVSEQVYKLIRKVCDPIPLNSLTYEELVDKLNTEYLKTKASQVTAYDKRVKYYSAKQEENESVEDWKTRIKNIFNECQFSYKGDNELNERFISGLHSTDIMRKVCEEINEVSFVTAAEIAINQEKYLKKVATKVDGKK